MLYRIAKLVLKPLWVLQRAQVRRQSGRLPEAQGRREGVAGSGRVVLRVLIVGDATAAGVGAHAQHQALAGRLAAALAQRLQGAVAWQVVARRGDTAKALCDAMLRVNLRPADVMVTTLGVRDLSQMVPVSRWLQQLDALTDLAEQRAGVQHVVHCGLPPLQALPLPQPLRWVLGQERERYHRAVAAWTEHTADRWWLPRPFDLEQDSVLMAADGFHPGPAIYALWGEQLAGMICEQIVPLLREVPRHTATPVREVGAARWQWPEAA